MVLYDALVKDNTQHAGGSGGSEEEATASLAAAAAVRAKVLAALGEKVASAAWVGGGGGVTLGEKEVAGGDAAWVWLAVRVVGASEGGVLCGDVEVYI
jgi:hypothetical protein